MTDKMKSIQVNEQVVELKGGTKIIVKSDGRWELVEEKIDSRTNRKNFRSTTWGMARNRVENSETGKIIEDCGNLLAYEGKVAGLDCIILYVFIEDLLVRAKYIITADHSNQNDFISINEHIH